MLFDYLIPSCCFGIHIEQKTSLVDG